MEQVLIYTDSQRINAEKAFLNQVVTYVQQLYDNFKAIGISLNVTELRDITQGMKGISSSSSLLKEFVVDRLLAIAGTQNFNGVPINQSKLKELLEIPDLSQIKTTIASAPGGQFGSAFNIDPQLLQLTGDVVSKTAEAFTTLENRYTFYSKNDKGAELTAKLLTLSTSLNNLKSYLNAVELTTHPGLPKPLLGLEFKNQQYQPDLDFIRKQEALYPNYVVV